MFNFIKRKLWVIKRWFQLLPIVNNTYDSDYQGAIELFKFQLGKIADLMDSDDAMSLNSEIYASKIRTFIRLADKVYDDEYAMEYADVLLQKYGLESDIEFESIKGSDNVRLNFVWSKNDGHYTDEEADEINRREFLISSKKQQKAERILWAFLGHNISGWWD